MDNHAVPRQITTFEFKLLGFFTLRQGAYLLIFTGLAVVVFFIIPVPILNFFSAFLVGLVGALLVFFRYNDRPTDVWIKNIFASLMRPSQFLFHKDNDAPAFLKGVLITDEAQAQTHLDASKKLHGYLTQTGQAQQADPNSQKVTTLIQSAAAPNAQPVSVAVAAPVAAGGPISTEAATVTAQVAAPAANPAAAEARTSASVPAQATPSSASPEALKQSSAQASAQTSAQEPASPQPAQTTPQKESGTTRTPFLSGVAKNSKGELLPNIMVYVNSEAGELVRILKTNHNGVFATFHQLPAGTYLLGPKDLGGTYFFDTINVSINGPVPEPIQVVSKELL